MNAYVRRWGVGLGPFGITWRDVWEKSWGLEIVWQQRRALISLGFKNDQKAPAAPGEDK